VDEPTSGLDSSTSKEIISILRNIAVQQHLTVVTVIHQPRYEIFTMFHKVILFSKGRVVYFGPSSKAVEYFKSFGFEPTPNVNPADYILDVISGSVSRDNDPDFQVENLVDLWEEHKHLYQGDDHNDVAISNIHEESMDPSENQQDHSDIVCTYDALKQEHNCRKTSFLTHFIMCLKRSIFQLSRDTTGFILDISLVYIAGLAIGVVFYETRYIGPPLQEIIDACPSVMKYKCSLPIDDPLVVMASVLSLGLALCGVMSSLSTFGDEIIVFIREYESNISPLMYFLAKNIVQLPIIVLTPAIFISIFYIISNPQGNVSE